jgi:hypothetical protein
MDALTMIHGDEIDQAQHQIELATEAAIKAARTATADTLAITGECHYGGEELHLDGQLFCNSKCADAYDFMKRNNLL